MNTQRSVARLQKSMNLDKRLMRAMMSVTAGRSDSTLVETFDELLAEYQGLLEGTAPDEQLLTEQILREKLADAKDWYARALEAVGRVSEAIEAFEQAAAMFDAVGKHSEAQRSRDKAGEIRIEHMADFDQEIKRLRNRLEAARPGTLDRIQVLVWLGELHSKANDDFEAVKYLEQAEKELAQLGGHPSDGDLLGDLRNTVEAINSGEKVAGTSAIEMGLKRRALTQQLLLALANAYRATSPDRAAEYEERLQKLDEGKNSDLRDLIGRYLDSGEDVSAFLASLSKTKKRTES